MNKKSITAQEFEEIFDKDDDIVGFLDLEHITRPEMQIRRISVDFPAWMIYKLDQEASLLGITRQSVIKFWISEKLRSNR